MFDIACLPETLKSVSSTKSNDPVMAVVLEVTVSSSTKITMLYVINNETSVTSITIVEIGKLFPFVVLH